MSFALPAEQYFASQEWPFEPGERSVKMYAQTPQAGITPNTGLMLVLHNWGGIYNEPQYLNWCRLFSNRYNVIALSVNYLQSGESEIIDGKPYDHGYLQAIDCLRALHHLSTQLDVAHIRFNRRRCYAMGASGGGNVALMANKFAPHTFACIVDICGMARLIDEVAYGVGTLDAGYSRDPNHPTFLSTDMREIRDAGNSQHLNQLFAANPHNKVIIIHGLDDDVCLTPAKIEMFRNMVKAGLRPDAHWLTDWHVDEAAVTTTGHAVGARDKVTCRFADDYLLENGRLTLQSMMQSDFERGGQIEYSTCNGRFIIDYATGAPSIEFHPD